VTYCDLLAEFLTVTTPWTVCGLLPLALALLALDRTRPLTLLVAPTLLAARGCTFAFPGRHSSFFARALGPGAPSAHTACPLDKER
jgi:hypothetical protein